MYLEHIKSPADVKKLNMDQQKVLCEEIRNTLVETVSKNGGHLASNLGVVELTVGLHTVFQSPEDSILFDVGHQSYVHKLLTGRYDRFHTIRQENGLSGFMNPQESEHDPVITGHSSNVLSAACGIAEGNMIDGNDHFTIAVVGDGAFTGGMTFEALNNSGSRREKLIVILNDNKMSISENVGAIANHLARIRIGERYLAFKHRMSVFVASIPLLGKPLFKVFSKLKNITKNALYSSNYFESMGFFYMGPIDGNSIEDVTQMLIAAKTIKKPVLIHAFTTKGKGYPFAEQSPTSYHGVPSFDTDVGVSTSKDSFSYLFGQDMIALSHVNPSLLVVTAAMTEGAGLTEYREAFPERLYDVGIAEEHAVTYCCGLSVKGQHPVFAVYSSFLQRGYDQLIHDAALGRATLTLAIDRAGIVGEDGATHQGLFDVSFLNSVPGAVVDSPAYYDELFVMLEKDTQLDGLTAVRYPRGKQPYRPSYYAYNGQDYWIHRTDDKRVAVTYGRLFGNLATACETAGVSIAKLNRIKPISAAFLDELMTFDTIWFYEESVRSGGVAERVSSLLLERGFHGTFEIHAVPDCFVPHMSTDRAFERFGFDVDAMISRMSGGSHE